MYIYRHIFIYIDPHICTFPDEEYEYERDGLGALKVEGRGRKEYGWPVTTGLLLGWGWGKNVL
jgi:hypothetical protein